MVATIPAVVHAFLRGHILAAAEKFEVTVICNSENVGLLDGLPARLILLPIAQAITLAGSPSFVWFIWTFPQVSF